MVPDIGFEPINMYTRSVTANPTLRHTGRTTITVKRGRVGRSPQTAPCGVARLRIECLTTRLVFQTENVGFEPTKHVPTPVTVNHISRKSDVVRLPTRECRVSKPELLLPKQVLNQSATCTDTSIRESLLAGKAGWAQPFGWSVVYSKTCTHPNTRHTQSCGPGGVNRLTPAPELRYYTDLGFGCQLLFEIFFARPPAIFMGHPPVDIPAENETSDTPRGHRRAFKEEARHQGVPVILA